MTSKTRKLNIELLDKISREPELCAVAAAAVLGPRVTVGCGVHALTVAALCSSLSHTELYVLPTCVSLSLPICVSVFIAVYGISPQLL